MMSLQTIRSVRRSGNRWAYLGLVLTLFGGPALAGGDFAFSGFGTVAVTYNDSDDFEFIRDLFQPSGVENEASTKVDSNLGVQLRYDFRHDTKAVVQVVSRHDEDGSMPPELNWAYIKHTPNPNWEIRAGRLGWDVYMLSDSRNVGYSHLWVRPPIEYFGFQQINHIDGLDIVTTRPLGSGVLSVKLYGGVADEEVPLDAGAEYDLSGTRVLGGHVGYRIDEWWFRLGYGELKLENAIEDPQLRQLLDALRASGEEDLANDMQLQDATVGHYVLGTIYERGPFQAQVMLNRAKTETLLLNDFYAGYTTVSYRLSEWRPYLSFAMIETDKISRHSDSPFLDPGVQATLDSARIDQHTTSLGVRYDFMENTALTFQVDRLWARDEEASMMRNAEPDWDGRATIVTMTLDFVF